MVFKEGEKMSYHIYENDIMDEILANDVRNQLQSNLGFSGYEETGKLDVGCKIEKDKTWKQFEGKKFYYRDDKVVIGNETFNVISLRSYDTIVGFRWMGRIYIIGNYTKTTAKQITSFIRSVSNPEVIYYNKRSI